MNIFKEIIGLKTKYFVLSNRAMIGVAQHQIADQGFQPNPDVFLTD